MTKIKTTELFKDIPAFLEEIVKEVTPEVTLTENQIKRLERKITQKVSQHFHNSLHDGLVAGDSFDFPHLFYAFPYESSIRKNEHGNPDRKMSIKTRTKLKRDMNAKS